MNASSNIEHRFGEMSYAIKRSGKPDAGSLATLMAVAVRGLQRRVCQDESSATPLTLQDEDFQGREAHGIKAKLWSPSAALPSPAP